MRPRLTHSLAIFLPFVLFAGCAHAIDDVRRTAVIGLHTVIAASEAVDAVDKAKMNAATQKAKTDPAGAQADLDKWDRQYDRIQKALTVAWDALRTAADGATSWEQGKKTMNPADWLSGLAQALSDLDAALSDAGIKL